MNIVQDGRQANATRPTTTPPVILSVSHATGSLLDKTALAHHTIPQLWERALAHESAGEWAAARALHDAIVERDPGRTVSWLRLSALAQREGRYRESRSYLVSAATMMRKTRNLQQLGFLTQRLLAFGEHDLVAQLIDNAPRSSPEWLAQSAVLGQQLSLIGRDSAALQLLDDVAPHVKPNPLLTNAHGTALRNVGRLDDAAQAYENSLAMTPDNALAHWSLAYLQPSQRRGARVDRVRSALAATATDSPDAPYLHYALFRELDDADDTNAAWTALQAGARARRRTLNHGAAVEWRGADGLRRLYTPEVIAAREALPHGTRTPIFVVGMPRTGTTVLERILGNHSAIASAGELSDLHAAMCSAADRFLGHPLDPAQLDALARVDPVAVGRNYLQRTDSRAGGSAYLIDKNPSNVFHAGAIARALPHARIVCLVRNPMDACFSNLKELFAGDAHAYSYDMNELASHYARFRELVAHWQQVIGDQFLAVEYEALVTDPRTVAERVMAFIGVDFDPASIEITRNVAPVSTASSAQVRQPINTLGVDAWRRYATQLEPLRAALQQAMPGIALYAEGTPAADAAT